MKNPCEAGNDGAAAALMARVYEPPIVAALVVQLPNMLVPATLSACSMPPVVVNRPSPLTAPAAIVSPLPAVHVMLDPETAALSSYANTNTSSPAVMAPVAPPTCDVTALASAA